MIMKYNWNFSFKATKLTLSSFSSSPQMCNFCLEYTVQYCKYSLVLCFPHDHRSLMLSSSFLSRYKNGQHTLTEFMGSEPTKKRKRRTSFTPQALEVLNSHFERNTHPSGMSWFTNCLLTLYHCHSHPSIFRWIIASVVHELQYIIVPPYHAPYSSLLLNPEISLSSTAIHSHTGYQSSSHPLTCNSGVIYL